MGESEPVTWVDSEEQVAQLCQQARNAGVVALDTEADSFHSYHAKLCLIQLSFAGKQALIDPLALSREALSPLGEVLADPAVCKILHGADYDLRMLQKDFGFFVKNLADTQAAAQVLGEKQTSLAALLEKELGVRLDKDFQRANWALRPLAAEMRAYAAADTCYLEKLLEHFTQRLREVGRIEWWQEECAHLEQVVYQPPAPDPWAFLRIKGARELSPEALGRLSVAWQFRERIARDLNVAPFRILSQETLLRLAKECPRNLQALTSTPGVPGGFARRWGRELLYLLERSQALSPPEPFPRALDRARERKVAKLRKVRDGVAQELGLEPGFLAPRATLEAVVDVFPQTPEDWYACLGRHWRVAVLAGRLAGALAEF
ncbi:MAG: ribonuclease D [Thermoanaerobaculaceae bacterium]